MNRLDQLNKTHATPEVYARLNLYNIPFNREQQLIKLVLRHRVECTKITYSLGTPN